MVTGVLVLHVGGDDIQVVQVHCGVVLALDLLGAFAARIGVLGRVALCLDLRIQMVAHCLLGGLRVGVLQCG